ncbi:hypothetical protein EYR40_000360 [Pleurotus pulmonarius]|nr:hypothetical protein EYR40_000360 [Pleurotus pulmonarius]
MICWQAIFVQILTVLSFTGAKFLSSSNELNQQYDFIVVGGGTAGNVLANRLSQDEGTSVLLIEAGGQNDALELKVPYLWPGLLGSAFDWNSTSTPQAALDGRTIGISRGFVLGGTSSINAMLYTRGSSDNYNNIATLVGDESWSWSSLQPYIHEDATQIDTISVTPPQYIQPIDDRVIETTSVNSEFPYNPAPNAGDQVGMGWSESTIDTNGRRISSATAYLTPAVVNRPNLDILLHSHVTRLLSSDPSDATKFTAVEFVESVNRCIRIAPDSSIFQTVPDPAGPNTGHFEFYITNGNVFGPPGLESDNFIAADPAVLSPLSRRPPFPTRPLFPVYPPPSSLTTPPPALPSPQRSISPNSPFTVSTHIVPAAWLRSTPYVPLPSPREESAAKEERKKAAQEMLDFLNKVRDETASARPEEGYKWVLWNAVNRYVKKGPVNPNGLTLFFVHANGFNKEIWETVLHEIFSSPTRDIAEVWSFEAVQTGDSALLNMGKLGAIYDWTDNARDILNFLTYFIPTTASSGPLPIHLPQVTAAESESRKKFGFKHRTLIGVGHSFGGCTSTLAALTNQSLYSSLILIDPVIVAPLYYEKAKDTHIQYLTLGSLLRRERWNSREEAKATMLKNPFFAAWHPDVLNSYIDYGLYAHTLPPPPGSNDKPAERVLLKMPAVQESIAFLESLTPYEVWERLKDVDERIALFWIMPKPENTKFGGPSEAQTRVWRRRKNASNTIVHEAGHLIPQEAPRACADEILGFLSRQYPDLSSSENADVRAKL